MSAEGEFPASVESDPLGSCPPLGGGAPGTPGAKGGVGGSGGPPPGEKSAERPLPWFKCNYCGKSVLWFKRTRAIHYKTCVRCRQQGDIDLVIHSLFEKG